MIVFCELAWSFRIIRLLTCRCVDAQGLATTVVVVAVVIAVFVLHGVNAVVVWSAHEACTSISAVEDVVIRIKSDVLVSNILESNRDTR